MRRWANLFYVCQKCQNVRTGILGEYRLFRSIDIVLRMANKAKLANSRPNPLERRGREC